MFAPSAFAGLHQWTGSTFTAVDCPATGRVFPRLFNPLAGNQLASIILEKN